MLSPAKQRKSTPFNPIIPPPLPNPGTRGQGTQTLPCPDPGCCRNETQGGGGERGEGRGGEAQTLSESTHSARGRGKRNLGDCTRNSFLLTSSFTCRLSPWLHGETKQMRRDRGSKRARRGGGAEKLSQRQRRRERARERENFRPYHMGWLNKYSTMLRYRALL